MGKTSIEWSDFSINPIRARLNGRVGHYCEKVSPGCKNCYSSRTQPRFGLPQFQEQRNRDVETFLDGRKLGEVLRRRTPTKWFWCDMTDMFGDWVSNEMIAACFGVMAATPWHTHQVLTKRAKRMRQWFAWLARESAGANAGKGCSEIFRLLVEAQRACDHVALRRTDEILKATWPLHNAWIGVSAENQAAADERLPDLFETPAALRFVSAEPLLGPLDLRKYLHDSTCELVKDHVTSLDECTCSEPREEHLDWVIAGGESGAPKVVRRCDIAWIDSLRLQCEDARVAFFNKQLGRSAFDHTMAAEVRVGGNGATWARRDEDGIIAFGLRLKHPKGGDPAEWPKHLRVRQLPVLR